MCTLMHNSPVVKVAGIHAGSTSAEVFAGEALIRAGAPAAGVGTQWVAHHALLGCMHGKKNSRQTNEKLNEGQFGSCGKHASFDNSRNKLEIAGWKFSSNVIYKSEQGRMYRATPQFARVRFGITSLRL